MPDPALVFEAPAGGAGTHVLLIGIGAYTYLVGGTQENATIAEGMEQLVSPPRSARVLADWFLDGAAADAAGGGFTNPDRPLASLAMVLAEATPARYRHATAGIDVQNLPPGNVDDVSDAIGAWLDRASSDRANQAIIFFSGHGIFAGNSVLLCRDYGKKPNNRFDGAINFDNLLGAMATKQPDYQLFFVDACRTPDAVIDLLSEFKGVGRSALTPDKLATRGGSPAKQSVHFATSSLAPSYGRTDGISIYADALLRGLNGGGAQPDLAMWVGTNGLQTALAAYTSRIAQGEEVDQEPDRIRSGTFKVNKPSRVDVPVYVTCDPDAVWDYSFDVEATCTTGGVKTTHKHDPATPPPRKECALTVATDKYDIVVTFPAAAPYLQSTMSILAMPPETPVCLPFEPRP